MGLIGELLEWVRGTDGDAEVADARVDPGGNDIRVCTHYQPSGVDSQPLPGDFVLLVPGPESGTYEVAGYLDPKNAGVSRPGDVRLYVRDGDGRVQGELHLTQDGEEPDWGAAIGALIARADRTDRELNKLKDAHNDHTHKHDVCGGGDSAVVTNAGTSAKPNKTYSHETVACDKGWVT